MSPSPKISEARWPFSLDSATLREILADVRGREILLRQVIRQMEQRYDGSLETLEARLARGEGQAHPDWEDSIEWRNAVEALQRTRTLERILEWLINSLAPSPIS